MVGDSEPMAPESTCQAGRPVAMGHVQRGVWLLERVQFSGADRTLHFRVKCCGPGAQVARCLRASPGAAISHDEQGHPRARVGQIRAALAIAGAKTDGFSQVSVSQTSVTSAGPMMTITSGSSHSSELSPPNRPSGALAQPRRAR